MEELDELHEAILAFWETLDQEHLPPAAWRRWAMQMLFGLPFLADGEEPRERLTHPYHVIMEGSEILSMVAFHLDALQEHPDGAIARALWQRVAQVSGRVLEALDQIEQKREEAA